MGQGLFIPLVRVSLINVGLGFYSETLGRGSIKNWNFSFLGKYPNIFIGSQSVSIEVCNIFQYFCWVSKRVYWGSHQALSLSLSLNQTHTHGGTFVLCLLWSAGSLFDLCCVVRCGHLICTSLFSKFWFVIVWNFNCNFHHFL